MTTPVRLKAKKSKTRRKSHKFGTLIACGAGIALVLFMMGKNVDLDASKARNIVLGRSQDLVGVVRNVVRHVRVA